MTTRVLQFTLLIIAIFFLFIVLILFIVPLLLLRIGNIHDPSLTCIDHAGCDAHIVFLVPLLELLFLLLEPVFPLLEPVFSPGGVFPSVLSVPIHESSIIGFVRVYVYSLIH